MSRRPEFALVIPAARLMIVGVCFARMFTGTLAAQAPATPKFEVVSIRSCKEAPRGGARIRRSSASVSVECQTVERLIRFAYLWYADGKPLAVSSTTGIQIPPVSLRQMDEPVKGSPAWISSDRFTIDAKAESPVNREMMEGPMMRAVLEERFKLKIHREAREVPVYELTVAKSGLKLQAAGEGGCVPRNSNNPPGTRAAAQTPAPVPCGAYLPSVKGGLEVRGVTIADFCRQLATWLDRDVIDKTGVSGAFDIRLDVAPADLDLGGARASAPTDPGASTTALDPVGAMMSALSKLGLKLESAKGPGSVLVIDHIERPSEN